MDHVLSSVVCKDLASDGRFQAMKAGCWNLWSWYNNAPVIFSKWILILSTDKVGGKFPSDFIPGKKSQTLDEVVSVYWYLENLRKWSQPFESYWRKESADQSCSELFTGQRLIPVLRESAVLLRRRRPTAHGLCSDSATRQCREAILYSVGTLETAPAVLYPPLGTLAQKTHTHP